MEKQMDMLQEQSHFQECLKLIRSNVVTYEAEYEVRHKETAELFKNLKADEPELYARAMTSASLEEHAANQLRKNKAALKQPYFGRIDYKETKTR